MLLDPKVYVCSRTGADKVGYIAKAGDSVHEFLSDESDYDIYLNGHTVRVERDYVLQDGDMINAIHRPAGAVAAYVAVAVIVSLIVVATLPKPEKPNTQGAQSTSPNNQVSGQTNIARTGEGIPDIKGTIRAYPDLIQSSWYTWEENRRRIRERFCVGIASLDISDVMDNETLFSSLDNSTATVVQRAVNSSDKYPVISDSISDSILEARNQRELSLIYVYLANRNGYNYVIMRASGGVDLVTLLDLNEEYKFTVSGTGKPEIDKDFNIDKSTVIYSEDVIVGYRSDLSFEREANCYFIPVSVPVNFPPFSNSSCTGKSNCYPDYIKNGYPYDTDTGDPSIIGGINVGAQTDGFIDWTSIKNSETGFEWYMNLRFPSGFILDDGKSETINFRVQTRDSVTLQPVDYTAHLDGIQVAQGSDVSIPISARSRSELGKTIKFTQQQLAPDRTVEFRVRRDTNINLDKSKSYALLETVYTLKKYPTSSLGSGFTLIDVDAKSDFTNKTQSSRKINMLASRKQYRASDIFGPWEIIDAYVFDWFSDAILSDFIDLFGWEKTQKLIDLDSLYSAFENLSGYLKRFDYSYDDADISLGQRIHTACNAARVGAYRDGQVWRFYREESKPVTYHFDRRNIAGNAESQMSFRFQKPNDHDSVSLSYIDPVSNKELHINRRINLTNGTFEEGLGQRPLEIDLAGCRNTEQAVNRAELEVRRLVYQRRTVSERVLDDGLLVDIGDRVRWSCIYDGDIVDAEVLEIDGTQLKLSEKVNLTGTLLGHITDVNGDVHGPYSVNAGSNGDFWIDGFDTSKAFVANNMPTQLGSRVIIGTTENLDYYDFTVTSKTPNADGTVQIEMIEYNELMFSED